MRLRNFHNRLVFFLRAPAAQSTRPFAPALPVAVLLAWLAPLAPLTPLDAQDADAREAGAQTPENAPLAQPPSAPPAPQLEGANNPEPKPSSEGYYKLSWSMPERARDANASDAALQFEVQESEDGAFSAPRVIYKGADAATTLSGRSTGSYYYRVRALAPSGAEDARPNDNLAASAWSKTLEVRVQHHSLETAFGFFLAGFAVFAFIAGLILTGYFKEKREERAQGR